jgi:delta-aminolevulinic acid dehydratase/porphobilinogen synthase
MPESTRGFPTIRPRRLRYNPIGRRLVRVTALSVPDLLANSHEPA